MGQTPVAVVPHNDRVAAGNLIARVIRDREADAVIAMTDQLAAGALDTSNGRMRVSGWDDSDLAITGSFTSVRQSLFDQGAACASIAAGVKPATLAHPWALVAR